MSEDLPEEFIAENDLVLKLARQALLIEISGIPNPCLGHEIEAGAMDHGGPVLLGVRSEEDGSAEDALKRCNKSPVLGTALLYTECIEHFCGAVESDPRGLLSNGHCRQKDRNQSILSPRESIARVTGDLQHEPSVSPFMEETSRWRPLHRESTEYKGPR